MKIINPVPGAPFGTPFGPRGAVAGLPAGLHNGQDFPVATGTSVLAAAAGTAYTGFEPGGFGNYIRIDHGNGWSTWYAHLSSFSIKGGAKVSQGQAIAKSGGAKGAPGSGASTGPHLHFSLRNGLTWVNPVPYFTSPTNNKKGLKKLAFYHREYRKARTIKPKQTLYLVDKAGKKANVVGIPGNYIITGHLYGNGFAEGDSLEVIFEWFRQGKAGVRNSETSPHYIARVQADRHGMIRFNPTFQRAVANGWQVHMKVYASAGNKKSGSVTVVDSDATALG